MPKFFQVFLVLLYFHSANLSAEIQRDIEKLIAASNLLVNATEPSYQETLFLGLLNGIDYDRKIIFIVIAPPNTNKSRTVHLYFDGETKFNHIERLENAKKNAFGYTNASVLGTGTFSGMRTIIFGENSSRRLHIPIIDISRIAFFVDDKKQN